MLALRLQQAQVREKPYFMNGVMPKIPPMAPISHPNNAPPKHAVPDHTSTVFVRDVTPRFNRIN